MLITIFSMLAKLERDFNLKPVKEGRYSHVAKSIKFEKTKEIF